MTVTASDGTNTPTTRTFQVTVAADTSGGATNPWASAIPTAPTSVAFQPASGKSSTLTTDNNSSTASELNFAVDGVTSGNLVTVYANGVAIGTATATSSSVVVTTNGTSELFNGSYTITATQTAENVAETDSADSSTSETANVDSFSSPASQLQVFSSLAVTSSPATSAIVGQVYSYTLQTNAPSGDTVTVTTGSMPSGMTYSSSTQTFTWTPTTAQAGTQSFTATLTDTLGNEATLGPVDVSVSVPLTPIQITVNASAGGNVTVSFSGNQAEVYDNVAKKTLGEVTFKSTDTVTIDCPAGQANSVAIVVPTAANAPLPQEVLVQGLSGSTNNQVTVQGTTGANTFTTSGSTITADGLATQISDVQKVALAARGSSNYFTLTSSSVPLSVVTAGSSNTLDFRHDTGGVNVNLGLDKGQAQSIGPWGTTLAITGVVNYLVGTSYADTLIGGPAAVTEIRGGAGNNTITGGSGENIILGGGGNDTITGGPNKNLISTGGGNSNIHVTGAGNMVFCGTTGDDSNDQALLNLLDDGSMVSVGYSARRLLASAASDLARATTPVSFQDSGAHDTIFGSNVGNWFMLGKYGTVKS